MNSHRDKKSKQKVRTRKRVMRGEGWNPKISKVRTSALQPYAQNARVHTPKQIAQIKNSIKAFSFINPIIADENLNIIAGHARFLAAKELGLRKVPVVQAEHLSEHEISAYRIADNKIAENATWDPDLLYVAVKDFVDLESRGEISFDLNTIGFETPEIDIIVGQNLDEQPDEEEQIPEPEQIPVVKADELWVLGAHRVYCGSSLEKAASNRVLGSDQVALMLTDPPYNVPVGGHIRVGRSSAHSEFAMASGEMSSAEFEAFLRTVFGNILEFCVTGTLIMCFMDWRHLRELDTAVRALGLEQLNLCVWVKSNGGMGSLYRSQHELCGVYKRPGGKHCNNIQLGKFGRNRTNVWNYAGVNSFSRSRDADLKDHPTVKPVAMIEDAIRDVTHRGDIIMDPFGGSGATLIAAERCRRVARLIEIDPRYVDVTIRRWQELTGQDAIEEVTGETWNARLEANAAQLGEGGQDVQ